jgi:hypothetical protein
MMLQDKLMAIKEQRFEHLPLAKIRAAHKRGYPYWDGLAYLENAAC